MPTEWDYLQHNFDESGEPVESGDADFGSFTDDDLIVDQGFRSEQELVDAYTAAHADEQAIGRANQILDQQNAQLEDAVFDAQLENGEGWAEGYDEPGYEQPAWIPPVPDGVDPQAWAESYQVAGQVMQQYLAGEALQPPAPTAEQQLSNLIAASTSESLAQLAAVEQSRAERAAWNEQQEQAADEQATVAAFQQATEILQPLLDKHNARNADIGQVMADASAILEANGVTADVAANMDEWQAEQVARDALAQAAERAGHAAITQSVLGPLWKGRR